MAAAAEPTLEDHAWTIAVARMVLGPAMNIQAPPNLQPAGLAQLIRAGINDWGGVSPVTPDHVNPEAPWPHLADLERATERAGRTLVERLAIYPEFAACRHRGERNSASPGPAAGFASSRMPSSAGAHAGGMTLARSGAAHARAAPDRCDGPRARGRWAPGADEPLPARQVARVRSGERPRRQSQASSIASPPGEPRPRPRSSRCSRPAARTSQPSAAPPTGCGPPRAATPSPTSSTATSTTPTSAPTAASSAPSPRAGTASGHREKPYDLGLDEIARRTREAWERGGTEVCLQGGIRPGYTGETYLSIVRR